MPGSLWRWLTAITPHVGFSCFSLLASIALPIAIILISLGLPLTDIFSFVDTLNAARKLSDVVIVLLTLGVGYTLMGLMFAYNTGRTIEHIDIPPGLFVFAFLLPILCLLFAQGPLFYCLIERRDVVLVEKHFLVLQTAVYTSITCFCLDGTLYVYCEGDHTCFSIEKGIPQEDKCSRQFIRSARMRYIVWFPPFLISLAVVGAYLKYRDSLLNTLAGLINLDVFTLGEVLDARELVPMVSLSEEKEVPRLVVNEGVKALVFYIRRLQPKWIVGVHVGGRLLSAYVAEKANVPPESCLFIRTSDDGSTIEFEPQTARAEIGELNRLDGEMLIIDDISRTGITFSVIRAFVNKHNYRRNQNLTRIYFATLLEVDDGKPSQRSRPDWSYRRTNDSQAKFPWSGLSAQIGFAVNKARSGFTNGTRAEKILTEYQKIATDYGYALKVAKTFIGS